MIGHATAATIMIVIIVIVGMLPSGCGCWWSSSRRHVRGRPGACHFYKCWFGTHTLWRVVFSVCVYAGCVVFVVCWLAGTYFGGVKLYICQPTTFLHGSNNTVIRVRSVLVHGKRGFWCADVLGLFALHGIRTHWVVVNVTLIFLLIYL